jgi:hypothetical protein
MCHVEGDPECCLEGDEMEGYCLRVQGTFPNLERFRVKDRWWECVWLHHSPAAKAVSLESPEAVNVLDLLL